jgi:hypothetical protein
MSQVLNNIETKEDYPMEQGGSGIEQGASLKSGPAAVAEVDVYNTAVHISLKVSPTGDAGQATWQPGVFVPPGHRTFIRKTIFGVRARSAVAAEPARVTIELVPEEETYVSGWGL